MKNKLIRKDFIIDVEVKDFELYKFGYIRGYGLYNFRGDYLYYFLIMLIMFYGDV